MTDHHLTDLLERVAERTDVGPPPLAGMLSGVRRRRRRHAVLGGVGLTAAVVIVAIAVPVLSSPGDSGSPPEPTTTQTPTISGPRPGADLEGRWLVVALVGPQGHSALPKHGELVRIRFHHGWMGADLGCNAIGGTYVQLGASLRFSPADMVGTTVGCGIEPPLMSRLLDVRSVAHDRGGTYLEDANGKVVVALVRPDQR